MESRENWVNQLLHYDGPQYTLDCAVDFILADNASQMLIKDNTLNSAFIELTNILQNEHHYLWMGGA